MNIHPKYRKIYSECAEILKKITEKKTTLKTAIFKQKKPAQYMPIVDKVLQNYDVLSAIVKETGFMKKTVFYSLILCSEILNEKVNNKYWKDKFEACKTDTDIMHVIKPKYIRINTTKASYSDIQDLKVTKTFIPNVYKLEENINFANNNAYKTGKFIVQNIASCIPAYLLNPLSSEAVIDACAAPGNKTAHMANIMENKGKIIAVEKDKERFNTLKQQLKKFGVKNTKSLNCDFLDLDPIQYKNIDAIMVDPSCSGSGIHDVYERDEDRLKNLQAFQIKILKHAMSFGASRISYSTCSIHPEEGEDVIDECLKDSDYELVDMSDKIKDSKNDCYEVSEKYIRCKPSVTKDTNGFFVAILQKKK